MYCTGTDMRSSRQIGSGGMADVYKAKDHKLNRFVAMKVLKQEFREDKAFISRSSVWRPSQRQVCAHPNIVNVYDVGEDHGLSAILSWSWWKASL